MSEKDAELSQVKSKLENFEYEKKLAISQAVNNQADSIKSLEEKLTNKDKELVEIKNQNQISITEKLNEKETEINKLKSQIDNIETEKKLAINEAVQKVEKERDTLANELKTKDIEKQNIENSLKQQFSQELKTKDEIIRFKDEEIDRVKDMKLKLSTKMLGESLEQHCEIEFNKLRATAFQTAYFEKDNDSRSGSKGDYIYRESDELGNEIISIMFEMKNEGDETATKKKNEDFF